MYCTYIMYCLTSTMHHVLYNIHVLLSMHWTSCPIQHVLYTSCTLSTYCRASIIQYVHCIVYCITSAVHHVLYFNILYSKDCKVFTILYSMWCTSPQKLPKSLEPCGDPYLVDSLPHKPLSLHTGSIPHPGLPLSYSRSLLYLSNNVILLLTNKKYHY